MTAFTFFRVVKLNALDFYTLPRMPTAPFEFQINPDKVITASTLKAYKSKLNALAKATVDEEKQPRVRTKQDILTKPSLVLEWVQSLPSRQSKSLAFAAIFYAIGRQDFVADPRALPIYNAFQVNYRGTKIESGGAPEDGKTR